MRTVVQRVSRAEVRVDGASIGAIAEGLLILVGVREGDTSEDAFRLADKIAGLRVFSDQEGAMNRSLLETGGDALVVSQFTLYADARKGRRPSFVTAASPELAEPLVGTFVDRLRGAGLTVETGEFGALMEVELVNDGPVTIILESQEGKLV